MHGSREISLVSSLHRASTDALIDDYYCYVTSTFLFPVSFLYHYKSSRMYVFCVLGHISINSEVTTGTNS